MEGPENITLSRTSDYFSHLAEELSNLRIQDTFTDIVLYAGDQSFRCHKVILAVNSPVLKAMLTTDMKESTTQEVKLDNINAEVMKTLIDYMYSGTITIPKGQLMETMIAADYLNLLELKKMCLKEVPGILHTSNVISWFKVSEKMQLDSIRKTCLKLMSNFISKVTEETEFLDLSSNEIVDFVKELCINGVASDDLLKSVILWLSYDVTNRVSNMEDLIHLVQLEHCSNKTLKSIFWKKYDSI